MEPLQEEFVGVAQDYYERGLSIGDMQQALYEAQLKHKRDNGKPQTVNVNERVQQ